MTFIDPLSVLGVLLTVVLPLVSGEYCDSGSYCDATLGEYCCGQSCCSRNYGYHGSFWNLWYFWFVMFIIMMSCCGMCSYAKRRQYYGQQHNQIIIPTGPGRMTNITATAYPVGVNAPPSRHPVRQQPPPQAYQSPPPYSEVTSKPELYPTYQGPPAAMPYPTHQYAYPPQFQSQPMYPPAAAPQSPPPPPSSTGQPQPPPYTNTSSPSAPGDN